MKSTREPADRPALSQGAEGLVSIIIAAYNAADTVALALATALSQTHPNIEVVVVDDGSTDGTAAIVEAVAQSDARVRLIRQANAGVCAARNAALAASAGEFVAPLDADDVWHPQRLRLHLAALHSAGPMVAVAYSPSVRFDGSGSIVGLSPRYTHSGDVFKFHLGHNLVGNGSGMTARRAVVAELGGYPSWLGGSEEFHLQLLIAQRYHFVACPDYLIGYRKRPGSLSDDEGRMLRSRIAVLRSIAPAAASRPARALAIYRTIGRLVSLDWRRGDLAGGWRTARGQTGGVRMAIVAVAFGVEDIVRRGFGWIGRRLKPPGRAPVATIDEFLALAPFGGRPHNEADRAG